LKGTLPAASPEEANLVPEWSIVLLMLLVTVGAVVVKAVTHNPFAASAEQAQRDLEKAYALYRNLQEDVDQRLIALRVAWHALQATYLDVRSRVQTSPSSACGLGRPSRASSARASRSGWSRCP
jgi:hypothetical protein